MDEFVMEIAGTAATVACDFGSTREYFKKYLTEKTPEFSVRALPEDRLLEQRLLDAEADREGLRRRIFTEPFLERAVLQRKIAGLLLQKDVLLLHGSTVAVDGAAYLFTARSGVGKSTHTRLWRQMLGERAVMVNDDRAFLRISDSIVLAYGSPWSGKHGLDTNICIPLAGICLLERGSENRIRQISAEEALVFLSEQCFVPSQTDASRVGRLAAQLAEGVPLWQMECTRDTEAAQVAFRAMSGLDI